MIISLRARSNLGKRGGSGFSKMMKNDESFGNVRKISGNSFLFRNFEIDSSRWRIIDHGMPMLVLLYEFPAETRLTVHRRLDIPNRSELARVWTREVRNFCRLFYISDGFLYHELLVSVSISFLARRNLC